MSRCWGWTMQAMWCWSSEVFDALQWKNVVGTLSGDDTFLIVARSERDAKTICTELTRHIG